MGSNMHQDKPKQEVKTLSIRVPLELYLTVSQYALDEDLASLNAAIIELVRTGIDTTLEKERIISQFIIDIVPKETLEKLARGE